MGEAIEPLELPAATGGNGALSYTLEPAVPGLTFTPGTRTLSGTPTTAGSYRMTYRVADADDNGAASDGDARTFTIAVQAPEPPDTAPSFTGAATDQAYTVGEAIEPLELPAATGGNGALSYTLEPAVPGLTFTPGTRTLSGTPTTAGSYRMTYRVADADDNGAASDGDARTFTIAVQAPEPPDTAPSFTGAATDQAYTVGEAIEPLELPAATGGNGALSYTLEPAVPGLTFTPGTRTLSGTPTTAGSYRMTYRVADADDNGAASDGDARTFTITVQPPESLDTAPSFAGTVADQTYTAGEVIEPLELPAATGGNGALSYTLEPAVPGLVFTPDTRTLSGTPTTTGSYRMTYRVADADDNGAASDGDARTFTITVQTPESLDTAPSFAGTVADQTYTVGEAIEPLELPAATGGNGALSYTLEPAVPGLMFTPGTRTLSGTPTTAGSYRMTYRVADGDDNGAASDGDARTFTITVQAPDPSFAGSVADQIWPAGQVIAPLVLPAADGGRGTLAYSLRPDIPGLSFDPDRRTLSGTPTEAGTHLMTYTVTDGKASASLTFTITIEPAAGLTSRYRGSGDQVFVLNPDGGKLDAEPYTLYLGGASAEVYVIATNTARHSMDPEIVRLDLRDAGAEGRRAVAQENYEPPPRPETSARVPERAWITEFNNNPPLARRSGARGSAGLHTQSQRAVAEGDRFIFRDVDDGNLVFIPATARSVVTDSGTTVVLWVADRDWGPHCSGAGPCLTGEMVDALADRFFRPGAGNDIHDWVTAIFGAPWGPHRYSDLIPPSAAGEIHILLFDIKGDGAPERGQCRTVGFFWAVHNFPQRIRRVSAERLIFFMDAALAALPEGPSWEVTDHWPSIVIATLAHEFQHMIHFYQKWVRRAAVSETWLNEMASEVAEDLIADKLQVNGPRGVAAHDPTAGAPGNRRGRLPYYNLFNDLQVTAWDSTIANYALNYALGAYLARTYGGAALFGHIVQSSSAGVDAIEAALAAGGHDVSFGEVLADWAVATLLSDNTAAPARYRYNPGSWSSSYADGEQYRLGSINLFNYRYEPPEIVSDCVGPDLASRTTLEGPYLHSLRTFNARIQEPHSNMFATLGRNTGTVRLSVSAETGNLITVVVKE